MTNMKQFMKYVKKKYKFMNDKTCGKSRLVTMCLDQMGIKTQKGMTAENVAKVVETKMKCMPIIYRLININVVEERCYISKRIREELKSKFTD